MKILVILGHPDPESFNYALFERVVEALKKIGHSVISHDLYGEGFDPILPSIEIPDDAPLDDAIERHCSELRDADGIVVVHPNWWGQPPAVLKGWIDRVFRPGVAYRFTEGDSGEGVPIGLLKAKAALILNTSNTPDEREMEVFSDPLETLWKNCIFGLCGIKSFHRRTFNVVVTSSVDERRMWLDEAKEIVEMIFPADDSAND
jgi:NAD(P)H dehydrogenase (quinone)